MPRDDLDKMVDAGKSMDRFDSWRVATIHGYPPGKIVKWLDGDKKCVGVIVGAICKAYQDIRFAVMFKIMTKSDLDEYEFDGTLMEGTEKEPLLEKFTGFAAISELEVQHGWNEPPPFVSPLPEPRTQHSDDEIPF